MFSLFSGLSVINKGGGMKFAFKSGRCSKFFTVLSVAVFSFYICVRAQAAMTVYPMETDVGKNGATQVKVLSQSDSVQFIKVTLKRIINPGTPQEEEVFTDTSSSGSLIITPQKLALTAGSERIVRLIALELPPQETAWRVYFEAVSEHEFNEGKGISSSKKSSAEVGINIVWGALVHVAPEKPRVDAQYIPSSAVIVNNGTVRMKLKEIGTCDSRGKCQWKKETSTVYPGTQIALLKQQFSPEAHYRIKYYDWLKNSTEEIDLPARR